MSKITGLAIDTPRKSRIKLLAPFEISDFRRRIKKTPTTIRPHQKTRVRNLNNSPEYKNIPKQKGVKQIAIARQIIPTMNFAVRIALELYFAIQILASLLRSEGASENSPQFQLRVNATQKQSPAGATDKTVAENSAAPRLCALASLRQNNSC
jgi:hypothetical protein